jgi:cobyrinic acid a,c-diamide synthase
VGSVGKIGRQLFPERHLGLIPPDEHDDIDDSIRLACSVAEESLDLDAIWEIAQKAPHLPRHHHAAKQRQEVGGQAIKVGVFRDAAFQFYYPENLEALAKAGAELVDISPLTASALPRVDALYIGGGFPETLAPRLTRNEPFLEDVRSATKRGLPIYAECGGAVFLGEELMYEGMCYRMAGVLPVTFGFQARPKGHGYVELEVAENNPFYDIGEVLRGHEFHHTYLHSSSTENLQFAFEMRRGFGFDGQRDGITQGNVLACYTHIHALGTESWAEALVSAAARFKISDQGEIDHE